MVLFDSLRPSQQFFSYVGTVLPGLTSTKQGLIHLAQGHNAVALVGSNSQPLGLRSSLLPLSHCAPEELMVFGKNKTSTHYKTAYIYVLKYLTSIKWLKCIKDVYNSLNEDINVT